MRGRHRNALGSSAGNAPVQLAHSLKDVVLVFGGKPEEQGSENPLNTSGLGVFLPSGGPRIAVGPHPPARFQGKDKSVRRQCRVPHIPVKFGPLIVQNKDRGRRFPAVRRGSDVFETGPIAAGIAVVYMVRHQIFRQFRCGLGRFLGTPEGYHQSVRRQRDVHAEVERSAEPQVHVIPFDGSVAVLFRQGSPDDFGVLVALNDLKIRF